MAEACTGSLLLHENYYERPHFMTERLLQRAGVEPAKMWHAGIETPNLDAFIRDNNVKLIVLCGERALGHVLEEFDILRWKGRAVKGDSWCNNIGVVPKHVQLVTQREHLELESSA